MHAGWLLEKGYRSPASSLGQIPTVGLGGKMETKSAVLVHEEKEAPAHGLQDFILCLNKRTNEEKGTELKRSVYD